MVCGTSVYRADKGGFMKNGDAIRAMTDEELAKIISDSIDCNVCQEQFSVLCDGTSKTCEQTWLDWLKEAAHG